MPTEENPSESSSEINSSVVNNDALKWASMNSGSSWPGLNEEQRERIKSAICQFIQTSGFTIGDCINALGDGFDQEQALMIVQTEISMAYSKGSLRAGYKLQREFPDMRIVKIWYTNNDDLVCDACRIIHGKVVTLHDEFEGGFDSPPAHDGCRCWMTTSTDILGDMK